jgi:hypothetical protein
MSRVDPRQHVRPQQRLRVAAAHINALNEMMSPNTSLGGGPLEMPRPAQNVIYCKNESGSDVAVGSALAITGPLFDPASGGSALATFKESSPITGGAATADTAKRNAWCVAIEPINSGKIGRVAAAGVVALKANVRSSSHWTIKIVSGGTTLQTEASGGVPVLWKPTTTGDNSWCIVRLGGGGGSQSVRLGKTTSEWNKGSLATIALYESGVPPAETASSPAETLTQCVNKFSDVGNNKWVVVALAGNDAWYLIAAEC